MHLRGITGIAHFAVSGSGRFAGRVVRPLLSSQGFSTRPTKSSPTEEPSPPSPSSPSSPSSSSSSSSFSSSSSSLFSWFSSSFSSASYASTSSSPPPPFSPPPPRSPPPPFSPPPPVTPPPPVPLPSASSELFSSPSSPPCSPSSSSLDPSPVSSLSPCASSSPSPCTCPPPHEDATIFADNSTYFSKFTGVTGSGPDLRPNTRDIVASASLTLAAMGIVSYTHHFMAPDILPCLTGFDDPVMLISSFGASVALVFGVPDAPVSQPRAVIFGHTLSASVGVACGALLSPFCDIWLSGPVSVSLSLALMLATRTFHPPASSNGLFFLMGGFDHMGWHFVLTPCLLGSCLIVLLGTIGNNLLKFRRYPRYWW